MVQQLNKYIRRIVHFVRKAKAHFQMWREILFCHVLLEGVKFKMAAIPYYRTRNCNWFWQ